MQLTIPIDGSANPMQRYDDQCQVDQRRMQEAKEDEAGDETQGPTATNRATNCCPAIEPTGHLVRQNVLVVVV